MPTLVLVASVALVVVVLVLGGLWLSRSRTLGHRVGSFRCAVGRTGSGPWSAGIAQYGAEHLYWWRHLSLAPRPGHRWERRGLAVLDRVDAGAGNVVVTCRVGGDELPLLMSREAYEGLTSWIEATPSRVDSVI
ncbi:DUF2550 family protein [Cellulomonas sp. PhB150]|uniref:DUF2550 family protein n=1 Tax=Cellulomonas sp. PhB150 TaxID=2485188 RepID=UPI000FA989AE|nr:DUF2550 family protein [Cellulomonas sp. PhB150]ROS23181.1 uncharacterized protein DUF2550 [Cellulomonas sp. PhB150]